MHSCSSGIYTAIKKSLKEDAFMIRIFQPARQGNEHCGWVLEQSRGIEKEKETCLSIDAIDTTTKGLCSTAYCINILHEFHIWN
jgi:hypothetical protein